MNSQELYLSAVATADAMQSILDLMPFGMLFLDRDLRIMNINSFLRERLPDIRWDGKRIPVERILGQRSSQTLGAFRQALEDGHVITLSTRFHRNVFRLMPLPGMTLPDVPQSVTILPVKEQRQVDGLIVIVQDVSDRVLAEDELTREINKLTALHELDLAVSTLEIDAFTQILVTRLRSLFNADFASLLIVNQERLELAAADGLPMPEGSVSLPLSAGISGWVVRHRQAVNIANVRQDQRYHPLFDSIRSEMAAPLIAYGQCLGVIDIESNTFSAFSQSDLGLLEMAAFSAANALHNARVHAEANKLRSYYQAVVNQTGDIIYTVDRDLRLTGVNAAWDVFAQENGGTWLSTNCIGKGLLSAFEGTEKEKWKTLCNELLTGARDFYREDIPCHAPEKERWLTLQAAQLKDAEGNISGIIFSTHDISEHIFAERRLRSVNTQLENLLQMAQVLNQNLPNRNIPQVTVENLAEMLQADCVTITQFDEEEQAFKVIAAHGASERHIRDFRSPLAQARRIIDQYGSTGIVYYLTDSLDSINLPIYQADHLQGLLYTIIEQQGKIIGSLNIFSTDPERRFSAEEQELVRALTPQIGLAMENARLYDQLQSLAITDGLTGLANRRQLDDLLNIEVERSKRYQRRFSILMIDLDHFKCYNDTFGHAMGDDLLQKISTLLKNNIRAGDIAARYGGDEFAVILPETGLEGAQCISSRLQKGVAALELPKKENVDCQRLSLSIGIAAYPEHASEPAALLRCADQALYRSKQLGRNRISVFNGESDEGADGKI